MRILATILDADSGEIRWGALNWAKPGAIKGRVGYLPQKFGMYKYLRVKEALKDVAPAKRHPPRKKKKGRWIWPFRGPT